MSSEEQGKPRIFVVDDEQIISSTLAIILNQSGFDATAFNQPLRALEAAQTGHPDLLLSDVVMPELSGIDLARQMLLLLPACKVLLISGRTDIHERLQEPATPDHSFSILAKPIHPVELLGEIRTALG